MPNEYKLSVLGLGFRGIAWRSLAGSMIPIKARQDV